MRQVFLDPKKNRLIQEKGYVVVDLFNGNECDRLLSECKKIHDDQLLGKFFTTTHSFDYNYRKICNEIITAKLSPYMHDLLDNYLPLFGNFMIKPPGNNSVCHLHQDWSFIDEADFRSVNVWLALEDTDVNNGCIHVVPGSQNLPFPVRGRNIFTVYTHAVGMITENLAIPIPLKKGQCIIFDSAILHYSPDNVSGNTRIAASLIFCPSEAQLMHYVYDRENAERLTKYYVDKQFFVKFGAGEDYFSSEGEAEIINRHMQTFDTIKTMLAKQEDNWESGIEFSMPTK